MSAVNIPEAREGLTKEQVTVKNILLENSQLILTVSEYQRQGRIEDAMKYQELLHKNLVYLAKLADSKMISDELLKEIDEIKSRPLFPQRALNNSKMNGFAAPHPPQQGRVNGGGKMASGSSGQTEAELMPPPQPPSQAHSGPQEPSRISPNNGTDRQGGPSPKQQPPSSRTSPPGQPIPNAGSSMPPPNFVPTAPQLGGPSYGHSIGVPPPPGHPIRMGPPGAIGYHLPGPYPGGPAPQHYSPFPVQPPGMPPPGHHHVPPPPPPGQAGYGAPVPAYYGQPPQASGPPPPQHPGAGAGPIPPSYPPSLMHNPAYAGGAGYPPPPHLYAGHPPPTSGYQHHPWPASHQPPPGPYFAHPGYPGPGQPGPMIGDPSRQAPYYGGGGHIPTSSGSGQQSLPGQHPQQPPVSTSQQQQLGGSGSGQQ